MAPRTGSGWWYSLLGPVSITDPRRQLLQTVGVKESQPRASQQMIRRIDGHFVVALVGELRPQVRFARHGGLSTLRVLRQVGGHLRRAAAVTTDQMPGRLGVQAVTPNQGGTLGAHKTLPRS